MKTIKKTLLLTLVLNLLFSCSLNKRRYMQGYNITWSKKQKNPTKELNREEEENSKNNLVVENYRQNIISDNNVITATNSDEIITLISEGKKNIIINEECDNLILQNGKEIKCKVIEISQTEIKYKLCENLDGPLHTINKNEALLIQYSNGTKEIITSSNNAQKEINTNANNENQKLRYPSAAVISLISSIVGWAILGIGCIFGIIFGFVALNKIKKNPTKYKGKGMAVLGIILGIIGVAVLFLVLALI